MKVHDFLNLLKTQFPDSKIEIRDVPHMARFRKKMLVKDDLFVCWVEKDWVEDEQVDEVLKGVKNIKRG